MARLDIAKNVSWVAALVAYVVAIVCIPYVAYGLRRHMDPFAGGVNYYVYPYSLYLALYCLLTFCVLFPSVFLCASGLLYVVCVKAWKSSFHPNTVLKKRFSIWRMLYQSFTRSRMFMQKTSLRVWERLPPRLKSVCRPLYYIVPVLLCFGLILAFVAAMIFIPVWESSNTQEWIDNHTVTETFMPLPPAAAGTCWSTDGKRCLYTGEIMTPLPPRNDTHCWTRNGRYCLSQDWDGNVSDADLWWWNGTNLVTNSNNGTANGTRAKPTGNHEIPDCSC